MMVKSRWGVELSTLEREGKRNQEEQRNLIGRTELVLLYAQWITIEGTRPKKHTAVLLGELKRTII